MATRSASSSSNPPDAPYRAQPVILTRTSGDLLAGQRTVCPYNVLVYRSAHWEYVRPRRGRRSLAAPWAGGLVPRATDTVDGKTRPALRRCVIAICCGVALLATTAAEALPVQTRVVRKAEDVAAMGARVGTLSMWASLVTTQVETGNPRTSSTFTVGCISVTDWAGLGRHGGGCVVLPRQPVTQGLVAPESARMRFRVRDWRDGGWLEVDMALTGREPMPAGGSCLERSNRKIFGRWLPTGARACLAVWVARYANVAGTIRSDKIPKTRIKRAFGVLGRGVNVSGGATVIPPR